MRLNVVLWVLKDLLYDAASVWTWISSMLQLKRTPRKVPPDTLGISWSDMASMQSPL